MNDGVSPLPALLNEAKISGDMAKPLTLLAKVREHANPIEAIGGWDSGNDIFGALADDCEFIAIARTARGALSESDRNHWVGLIRWFLLGLSGWRRDRDPQFYELTALMAFSQYSGFDQEAWRSAPDDIGFNEELLNTLVALNAGFSSRFLPRFRAREPLWERELVDQVERAESEGDWLLISERWNSFSHAIYPNTFQTQLLNCLCRFDFNRLIVALEKTTSVRSAMNAVGVLSVLDRFRIGIRANNNAIRFSCVFSTFENARRAVEFNQEEELLLSELLSKVMEDEKDWPQWMRVFNRFPTRYPKLQTALGKALARGSDAAIQSYVGSINLFTGAAPGRAEVASCLREFAGAAPLDRRLLLWESAHRRWSEWDFGAADPMQHLFKPSSSDLDYAVVAYCVECLDEEARAGCERSIFQDLFTVDNQWHRSLSDCLTHWNRSLSRLQPYAHAGALSTSKDDCLATTQYVPRDILEHGYTKMMLSVG